MPWSIVQTANLGRYRLLDAAQDSHRHLAPLPYRPQPLRLGFQRNRHPVLEGGYPDRVEELKIVDAGNHKSAPKNQKAAPPVVPAVRLCSHLFLPHSITTPTHKRLLTIT